MTTKKKSNKHTASLNDWRFYGLIQDIPEETRTQLISNTWLWSWIYWTWKTHLQPLISCCFRWISVTCASKCNASSLLSWRTDCDKKINKLRGKGICLISRKLQQDRTKPNGIGSCDMLLWVNHYPLTLKHRTRSPLTMVRHSEDSSGMDCWRIAFLTFIHSSSSAPNPLNLTRTSYNSNVEILGYIE
jgi:hypothetical protein